MQQTIRVYLVDDHPLVREWLGNLLRLEPDIDVVGEADDVPTALADIERLLPDVLVVDLSLKRGSGLDLIKAVEANIYPKPLRCLVLSMHEEIGDVERAFKAGALGYVMKRESTSQVVNAIRQVHAGKLYAAPEVLSRLKVRRVETQRKTPQTLSELLSGREIEVFRRLGAGHSTKRIADDLSVSQKTIQTYCARIKEKLALNNGSELMREAVRMHEK